MKNLYWLLLFIPNFSLAQVADELYNHAYERLYHYVSYTQIKKDSIKVLKYTLSDMRPVSYKDVDEHYKVELEDYTKYFIEFFDEDGLLLKKGITESDFKLNLTQKIESEPKLSAILNSVGSAAKKSIAYASLDNKVEINYSEADHSYQVKSSINNMQITRLLVLDKFQQIIQDSTCRKLPATGFCTFGTMLRDYLYDEDGRLIQKTVFVKNQTIIEKLFYNDQGLLEKIEIGDAVIVEYLYSNRSRLDKVSINNSGKQSFIEIGY